jgi:hypothetical protein
MAPMTAEQAEEYGKTLDFAKVWAALMKTDEQLRESQKKTDEQIARMSEKADKVTANVGGLNRSMGELIETLVAAKLWEKFTDYPYNLKRTYQRIPLYDENNITKTDIDILLSDTGWCMAVEVKRELDKKEDVDAHLKRMELIRKYPPAETVGKKLLGAMAGGVVDPDVRDYAHKSGFFVLELTGESVSLLKTPEGFEPQQW